MVFAGDKNLGGKCGLNKAAALLLAGAPEISEQRSQPLRTQAVDKDSGFPQIYMMSCWGTNTF